MLQNKIRQSTFTLDRILARMRTQKAKVFDQTVIPAQMCSNNIWAGTKVKGWKMSWCVFLCF